MRNHLILTSIWRVTLFAQCIVVLGTTAVFAASSRRAFLPVTSTVSDKIFTLYKVRVKPGLYYQDQWDSKLIPELRITKLDKEKRGIDLRYLRDDAEIQELYQHDALRGTDVELTARVGWIDRVNSNGVEVRELWLEKPNHERWMLFQHRKKDYPSDEVNPSPNRMMGLPKYFLPEKEGIIAFTPNWILWHKKVNGALLSEFAINKEGEIDPSQKLKIYTREFENEAHDKSTLPLLNYSASAGKALMAIWPVVPVSDSPNVKPPKEVDLVVLNLQSDKVHRVATAIPWPFLLTNDGVWFLRRDAIQNAQKLIFQRLNWGSLKLDKEKIIHSYAGADGECHFYPDRYVFRDKGDGKDYVFNTEGTKIRLRIPEDEFISLKDESTVQDLRELGTFPIPPRRALPPLRMGKDEPRVFHHQVNEVLSSVLSQSEKTWAQLVYQDGMLPSESLMSFLWGLDSGHLDGSPSIRVTEEVFVYEADRLFANRTEADLEELMRVLAKVTDGTRSILVLEDFPVRDPALATSSVAQQRVQIFAKIFGRCLKAGTCRVVTTSRTEVFDSIRKLHVAAFENGDPVIHPDWADNQRIDIARILAISMEEKTGISFNKSSFMKAMQMCGLQKAEGKGKALASPGAEEAYLKQIFTFALSEKRRHPEQNIVEINMQFLKRFENSRSGSLESSFARQTRQIDFKNFSAFLKRNVAGKGNHRVIDEILASLESQLMGDRPQDEGPPAFLLTGNTGVGKTTIAQLVAKYLLALGDENKALLMADDDVILFHMSNNARVTFSIDPKGPQAKMIKEGGQGRVVIFDDIQEAEVPASIGVVGQILDKGWYKQGDPDQLNLKKVSAVFITTNWGADLIREGRLKDGSFEERLKAFLMDDDKGPHIKEGLWARFRNNIYALPDLTEWELLDVAFIVSTKLKIKYQAQKQIQFLVDPDLFIRFLDEARNSKGQGRDIARAILAEIPTATKKMELEGVRRILLTRSGTGKPVAKTDLDPDFEDRWALVEGTYREYEEQGIDAFLDSLEKQSKRKDLKGLKALKMADDENPEGSR